MQKIAFDHPTVAIWGRMVYHILPRLSLINASRRPQDLTYKFTGVRIKLCAVQNCTSPQYYKLKRNLKQQDLTACPSEQHHCSITAASMLGLAGVTLERMASVLHRNTFKLKPNKKLHIVYNSYTYTRLTPLIHIQYIGELRGSAPVPKLFENLEHQNRKQFYTMRVEAVDTTSPNS